MKKLFLILISFLGIIAITSAQNNCLEFDGTDDYVQMSSSIVPAKGTDYTVECWFYADALSKVNQELLSQWSTQAGDGFFLGFNLDEIRFTNDWLPNTGVSVTAGQWHHLAAVSTATNAHIYVDGILRATKGTVLSYIDGIGPLVIGQQGEYTGDEYFDGKIDEVRIWNDVRSEDEIRMNMYQELTNPAGEGNLVAYYKFNETSNTTLTDSKGSNNGALTNYGSQSGYWQTSPAMFGPKNALDFDGTDEYVDAGNKSSLAFGNYASFTYEAWIYSTNPASGAFQGIVYHGLGAENQGHLGIDGSGNLSGGTGDHSNSWVTITTSYAVPQNTWVHVAMTLNRHPDTNLLKFYANGVEISNTSFNYYPSTPNTSLTIALGSGTEYFAGKIDEVRIWHDVRTASEIRENMCKNLTGNESGLVGYYNFDNTSEETLQDFSGNDNNGTLTNMENSDWVSSSAFNTWLNTSSSDWTSASNWSRGSAPGSTDNVGNYSYSDGTNVALIGTPTVANLLLGGSSSMTLSSGLTINNNLILESDLDLNGQTIVLGSSATLIEDAGRIYGTSGHIETTRTLSAIDENVAGLGAEITTAIAMGSTTIIRTHAATSDPISIERGYQITPTTNTGLDATLVFHYDDEELNNLTEADLKLYKSSDGANWNRQSSSTVNTSENTLTLSGIDGFSHWTASDGLYLTGNALDFDATDKDYVSIPHSSYLEDLTAFTIETWIKTPTGNNDMKIVGKTDGTHSNGFALDVINNTLYCEVFLSSVIYAETSTSTFNNAEWTHIAMSWSSGGNITGYINGIEEFTKSTGSANSINNTNAMIIGIAPWDISSYAYDGSVDEVRVWNDVRTEFEIRENMCQTLIGNEENLVAYYNCNSSSGSTLYDISGNENYGTLFNSPTWESSNAFNMWLGETDNSWSTDANWSLGSAPNSATSNVGITDRTTTYASQIGSSVALNNLVVNENAELTFSSGSHTIHGNVFNIGTTNLEANTDLAITGSLYMLHNSHLNIKPLADLTIDKHLYTSIWGLTGTLKIESSSLGTGSLIVNESVTGDITMERYMNDADWTNWQDGWHFLSSPVETQAIDPNFITDPITEYDFYCWWELTNEWINFKNQSTTEPYWPTANVINNGIEGELTANFKVGKGYMTAYNELQCTHIFCEFNSFYYII